MRFHYKKDKRNKHCYVPFMLDNVREKLHGHHKKLFKKHFKRGKYAEKQNEVLSHKADYFEINLDVEKFLPEDITVKMGENNMVVVEAKHEERQDKFGYISRHFIRKYIIPDNCDVNKIGSKLSNDGILTITAPKINMEDGNFKEIPIELTGESRRVIEDLEDNNEPITV